MVYFILDNSYEITSWVSDNDEINKKIFLNKRYNKFCCKHHINIETCNIGMIIFHNTLLLISKQLFARLQLCKASSRLKVHMYFETLLS